MCQFFLDELAKAIPKKEGVTDFDRGQRAVAPRGALVPFEVKF
jgi:hypothetical protein